MTPGTTIKPIPQQSKIGQKLIRNVLANFVGQFSTLVIAFAAAPYVVHRVGADRYGLLVMVAALGGLGGFNLGMGTALAKFISEPPSSQDQDQAVPLVRTAVTSCGAIAILCCVVIVTQKKAIAGLLFHGSSVSAPIVDLGLYIIAACILMALVSDTLSGILIGLQRFDLYNRIRIATSIVRNLGAVLVLALGFYIKALLGVYLLAVLIGLIAYVRYSYKLMPGFRLRPSFVWLHFKRLAGFAIPILVAGLGVLMVVRFDRVLVAYYLPLSAVTFYAIPYMLAEKSGVAVSNITSAVFPISSELSPTRDDGKLRELYFRSTKMVVLLAIPVAMILLVFSAPILRWWMGQEYALRGALTLNLLALGYLVNICGYVPSVVAQGLGSPWISAKYALLNGIANIILFILLIPRFGINGAAGGFLISELAVTPFLIRKVNMVLGVGWLSLTLRSFLRPAICGLVSLAVLLELRSYVHSLITLTLFSIIGLISYGLMLTVVGIDKQERDGIISHLMQFARLRARLLDT